VDCRTRIRLVTGVCPLPTPFPNVLPFYGVKRLLTARSPVLFIPALSSFFSIIEFFLPVVPSLLQVDVRSRRSFFFRVFFFISLPSPPFFIELHAVV